MPKRRILIDGYYIGKPSGYGRFVGELLRSLGLNQTPFEFLVAIPDTVEQDSLTAYPGITYVRAPHKVYPIWEQITVPACARAHDCAIIHSPYNTRAIYSRGAKTVTTVHDLTFLNVHTGRDIKSIIIHLYMAAAFYGGTIRSRQIIAVSDTTKRALSARQISSRRIYNSVDGFVSIKAVCEAPPIAKPYFLHRGSYAVGHRNTERIIQAFLSHEVLSENYELVIIGAPDGAQIWQTEADPSIKFLGRLSDEELATLYAGSTAVVAVSLLEGFCLPIVEAFGFGVPVITSDINPMREIAANAALIVSATDTDAIAAGMLRLASDPSLAAELVQKGSVRLREFSSEKMAKQLIDTYRHILDRERNQDVRGEFLQNQWMRQL